MSLYHITDTIEEGYEVFAPLRVTPCNAACYETRAFYEQLLEVKVVEGAIVGSHRRKVVRKAQPGALGLGSRGESDHSQQSVWCIAAGGDNDRRYGSRQLCRLAPTDPLTIVHV